MTAADGPDTMIDGRVEHFDEALGVAGWAVDLHDPAAPVTVELWAGDDLIDTATTGLARPDVCDALRIEGMPGYSFDASVNDHIRAAAMRGIGGELVVRAAGHADPLESFAGRRTLERVRLAVASDAPVDGDALIARLALHARDALDRADKPMRPTAGHSVGFVETIALDDFDLIWVTGWIQDDGLFDRPIVILDHDRHGAGFAYTFAERGDLPAGAKGFVGVLHTDWRASPDLPPCFFLADGSGRYLESLAPTPIYARQTIAPAIRDALARARGGHRDLLRDLFRAIHHWHVPDDRDPVGLVQVDEVAVLPGFGALIGGWALSPNKESRDFTLKAGQRVIAADQRSVARFPRADLAHLHGHLDLAVARAGFTAVFQGDLSGIRLDEMVLKAGWSDGTETNVGIAPDCVRLLGGTVPIDRALTFYPGIEAEGFFPDFAHHAAAAARERARALTVYEAAPVEAAIVLAAPSTLPDLFLLFDGALRHAASLPADWGIAIVGCPDGIRPVLVSLFADLKRTTGRACSLLLTTAAATNDVLAEVIDTLGLQRVAFVGPNVSLTRVGWAALGSPAEDLTLLEVHDLAARESTTGLDAFACDAGAWRRIAAVARPRIGGVAIDPGESPSRVIPDAALALAVSRPSALVARINAVETVRHD